MNKTVGPPSITPNSATGSINPLSHGNTTYNLYSYYYKSIEQFQKPSTEKELCEILIKGPMPTNAFYNNFINEINNKNNQPPSQQQQLQSFQSLPPQQISNLNNNNIMMMNQNNNNNNSPPSHLPYSRSKK